MPTCLKATGALAQCQVSPHSGSHVGCHVSLRVLVLVQSCPPHLSCDGAVSSVGPGLRLTPTLGTLGPLLALCVISLRIKER